MHTFLLNYFFLTPSDKAPARCLKQKQALINSGEKKLSLEFLALQINMKSLQCGSIIESTDLISGVAKVNFSPSCIHNELVIIVREHCSSECFQI